ncbi:MAG: xanthine dehydrogenase accessory protein XdhC [Spongiibacteraceae bacterium]|nr:xanthine dehydrogenase accessory protein XdhC [Spongiibacteraceae bacterium]
MMSWVKTVAALGQQGLAYVLITVLGVRGSTPRDNGTKMVVSHDDFFGSIGGGHLEYKSIELATKMLRGENTEQQRIEHFPLGASLGQCCGGSVSVLFEYFSSAFVNIMLFGAGHVGQALARILQELPCRVWWVDSRESQHQLNAEQQQKTRLIALINDSPEEEVATMPAGSYYIVMTHNHPMDYKITETVLARKDARYIGLIGSSTKWKRFQMRMQHRGYHADFYKRVHCPVGLSAVPGKHPMEVAVSIAAQIIAEYNKDLPERTTQRGINWRGLKPPVNDSASLNEGRE